MLERFPRLRQAVKEPYKAVSYWFHREAGFSWRLEPGASLVSAFEWAGLDDPPVREGEWFFGYFDKTPWPRAMDRALLHHRTGTLVEIAVLDRTGRDVVSLGRTSAWNWQQGAMAQWLPLAEGEMVVYNDLSGQTLGCRICHWDGRVNGRFVPWPVQAVHPGGKAALSLNYLRLARLRPEYGYRVEALNFRADQPLDRDGLWLVDLASGGADLIVSLERLRNTHPVPGMDGAEHKVNHAVYSPDGERFVFLHRWLGADGKHSRLYVCRGDGSDLKLLLNQRMVSHYHWRDDHTLVVYGRTAGGDGYYLVDVEDGGLKPLAPGRLNAQGDGHCSFSRDGRWLVTDSYPDKGRQQHLMLYQPGQDRLEAVGRFLSPRKFDGYNRCDLHPRLSWDGKTIAIDSVHTGVRRTYFIDVTDIVSPGNNGGE